MDIGSLMSKMKALDHDLLTTEFIAPYIGGPIITRIAGIVYTFSPYRMSRNRNAYPWPKTDHGIFRWKPIDTKRAIAQPTGRLAYHEYRKFLEHFPILKVIVIRRHEGQWLTVPWNAEEVYTRFGIGGVLPVYLCDRVERFDVVNVAFTPELIYMDRARLSAGWLRELKRTCSGEQLPADPYNVPGLPPEGRTALDYLLKRDEELKIALEEQRIRTALGHMDAELVSYMDQGPNQLVVRWKYRGIEYRTVVQKDNLEVVSAGICLSGQDRKFDLTSIVSVMRERQDRWGDDHFNQHDLY